MYTKLIELRVTSPAQASMLWYNSQYPFQFQTVPLSEIKREI